MLHITFVLPHIHFSAIPLGEKQHSREIPVNTAEQIKGMRSVCKVRAGGITILDWSQIHKRILSMLGAETC